MSNKVDIDSARRWSMAAFSQTQAEGFYTASSLSGIPGAQVFHLGAKRTGLAEPIGARNRWVCEEPPKTGEIQKLLDFYFEYTNKQISQDDRLARIESKLDALLSLWE